MTKQIRSIPNKADNLVQDTREVNKGLKYSVSSVTEEAQQAKGMNLKSLLCLPLKSLPILQEKLHHLSMVEEMLCHFLTSSILFPITLVVLNSTAFLEEYARPTLPSVPLLLVVMPSP